MALLATLALVGCAHDRGSSGGETITLQAISTAFCLACPSYTITLGPDGQGIFNGQRNTAARGEHRFTASPEQVTAFTERLRPYRPKGERLMTWGRPECGDAATDQNSIDVRWQPALKPAAHLAVYEGCNADKNHVMVAALESAPDLLPVADLIGKH